MFRTIEPKNLKVVGKHDLFIHQISNNNPKFSVKAIANQTSFLHKHGFQQSMAVETGYLYRWTHEGNAVLDSKNSIPDAIEKEALKNENNMINKLLSRSIYAGLRPIRLKSNDDRRKTPGATPRKAAPKSSKNSKELERLVGELETVLNRKLPKRNGFYFVELTDEEKKIDKACDLAERIKRPLHVSMRQKSARIDANAIAKKGFINYVSAIAANEGPEIHIVPWSAIVGKQPNPDYKMAAANFQDRLKNESKVQSAFNQLVKEVSAERLKNANVSKDFSAESKRDFEESVKNYLQEEICYFQMLISIAIARHQNENTKGAITYLGYPYKSSVIGTLVFKFMCEINSEFFENPDTRNIFQFFDNTDILEENITYEYSNEESKVSAVVSPKKVAEVDATQLKFFHQQMNNENPAEKKVKHVNLPSAAKSLMTVSSVTKELNEIKEKVLNRTSLPPLSHSKSQNTSSMKKLDDTLDELKTHLENVLFILTQRIIEQEQNVVERSYEEDLIELQAISIAAELSKIVYKDQVMDEKSCLKNIINKGLSSCGLFNSSFELREAKQKTHPMYSPKT